MREKTIEWKRHTFSFQDNEDDDDNDFEENDSGYSDVKMLKLPQIINTPLGPYKFNDSLNPFKQFNFWMGEANFDITHGIINKIKKVSGVEILIVLTRYRFIVAIGSIFDESEVQQNIEIEVLDKDINTIVLSKIENKRIKHKLIRDVDDIKKESKYWVMYVFPNGMIHKFGSEEICDELVENLELCHELKELSGGIILNSHSNVNQ